MEPVNDRIIPINIEEEMKSSYIDYSMSVIVSRALPDVRDGLKPVHRRVLYGMSELGLSAGAAYKKSARIVGEVLGKYHPHGDSAVYDTMVRMAQDFSLRYPLVDGQGNFGSVDGDSAAAMRYTEARMTRLAEQTLADLNKETVDFQENFDGSLMEPEVLPAALPNLLLNGTDGIAVGMATKIPPHNLGEVIDGVVAYIDDPDITVDDLIEHIPAPDFPTGGIIYGYAGVLSAYRTGRGRVIMRAKMHEEEVRPGRNALIISEIPFQVNKASLIEKIAAAARDKRVEGISDMRDESDRNGMRIVVELRKDAVPLVTQNQLYKYTQCQQTFGVNLVALVNGRPRTLTLHDCIRHYVDHRHDVVVRRTAYDLRKAQERAHILEGLRIALDHIDAVIAIIRESPDTEAARANLMAGVLPAKLTSAQLERLGLPTHGRSLFTLSEVQASAILDMRLRRLTGLERQRIEDEYRALRQEIERLQSILDSRALRMEVIKTELLELKEKFNDERRTEIDYTGGGEFLIEDLIDDEQVVVTISHQGLVKRTSVTEYRQQGRGGVGVRGSGMRDEDFIEQLFVSNTHDYLLFFTDHGQCYWLRVFEIPEGSRTSKGRSIRNLIQIAPEDKVRAVLSVSKPNFRDPEFLENHYVVMATRQGLVKKTSLEAFSRPRVDGIIAISIVDGDELIEAHLTDGVTNVMLACSAGRAIRFHEDDVRAMGRNTRGVKGMALREDEVIVGMIVIRPDEDRKVLVVSANGYGKQTPLETLDDDGETISDRTFRKQSRGGKGIIALKTTRRTGDLVAIKGVYETDDLMIVTTAGIMIRMNVEPISVQGRNTQGVRLINLKDGDAIADVTRVVQEDDEEDVANTAAEASTTEPPSATAATAPAVEA
ncbi:MAG: DNA gyrase subunit A [Bacteroidota bacterium]